MARSPNTKKKARLTNKIKQPQDEQMASRFGNIFPKKGDTSVTKLN